MWSAVVTRRRGMNRTERQPSLTLTWALEYPLVTFLTLRITFDMVGDLFVLRRGFGEWCNYYVVLP